MLSRPTNKGDLLHHTLTTATHPSSPLPPSPPGNHILTSPPRNRPPHPSRPSHPPPRTTAASPQKSGIPSTTTSASSIPQIRPTAASPHRAPPNATFPHTYFFREEGFYVKWMSRRVLDGAVRLFAVAFVAGANGCWRSCSIVVVVVFPGPSLSPAKAGEEEEGEEDAAAAILANSTLPTTPPFHANPNPFSTNPIPPPCSSRRNHSSTNHNPHT